MGRILSSLLLSSLHLFAAVLISHLKASNYTWLWSTNHSCGFPLVDWELGDGSSLHALVQYWPGRIRVTWEQHFDTLNAAGRRNVTIVLHRYLRTTFYVKERERESVLCSWSCCVFRLLCDQTLCVGDVWWRVIQCTHKHVTVAAMVWGVCGYVGV